MKNVSKLAIGIAACGGLLLSLNYRTPHASLVGAATLADSQSRSTAATEDARPVVLPVADTESNTTEVFASMRAALATAKSRARELTSYTAILEMREEVRGKLRDTEIIQVKLRQEPFSVYMRWTDDKSPRIVEHYAWRAIDQAATLSDGDFDEKNSDYEFVAR